MFFFDRERELKILEEILRSSQRGKFNFVVIVGRRGVGKTRLIHEFSKRVSAKLVYLFVEKKEIGTLIAEFVDRIEKVLGKEVVKPRDFRSFLNLLKEISREEELVVVFDELQNFRYSGEEVFFQLQEFVDFAKFEEGIKLMIVAIGSIVGMMKDIFKDRQSPLYDRKTAEIFLKPFEFWEIRKLLKILGVKNEEEIFEIYSILGGMPRYYDFIDRLGIKLCRDSAIRIFTNKAYAFWKGVRDELIEEFKEAHPTYFSILEAIARGKVKASEISVYTSISEKSIHKYLIELTEYFEIVEKRIPAMAPPNYRGAIYVIRDPFYRFWFRYIFPNQDMIELEKGEELAKEIVSDLPNHTAFIFEEVVRRTLLKASGAEIRGVNIPLVSKVESWWDRKGNEIDFIGYRGKKIYFVGEVKWREKPLDFGDLEALLRKLPLVKAEDALIILVSKSGFSKSVRSFIEERGGLLLDLKDLCELWDSFID